jgi:pimeloyl-ACP methyl ester carboxylesterase
MLFSRQHLTFTVLEFGDKKNEAIILLHGFPSNAQSWKPVAKQLASEGYYVLALEQRGYTKNTLPKRRRDYKLSELVDDVSALLDNAHLTKAHIVGYDWGGGVSWAFASTCPQRTQSLITISTPHPKALLRSLFSSKQFFLSWYMLFFQIPWLPEKILRSNKGRLFKSMLSHSGLDEKTVSIYAQHLKDNAILTGSLNWYRALPFSFLEAKKINKLIVPTLFIYGKNDIFLSQKAAETTGEWINAKYTFRKIPQATHWIPEESPKWLADEIIEWISSLKYPGSKKK